MNIYFITVLCLYVLSIGYALAKHGENKKDKYNFFTTFISSAIMIFLIYKAITYNN